MWGQGGGGIKGKYSENRNSIINKIYFKNKNKRLNKNKHVGNLEGWVVFLYVVGKGKVRRINVHLP